MRGLKLSMLLRPMVAGGLEAVELRWVEEVVCADEERDDGYG